MICTGYNQYILKLIDQQTILWKCILSDGTQAWSDFDIPDQKDPWTRLKIYCNNNDLDILQVRVLCPGMEETVIFEDESGLDNFFITRGMCKDIVDDDDMTFSFMSFGIVKEDGHVHVKKFYWPQFELGASEEVRLLTPENKKMLYNKRIKCKEGCSCQKNKHQ
jgi:hypothetical protein